MSKSLSLKDISEPMLSEYCELDKKRLALDRESSQLMKARDIIGKQVKAALEAEGRTEVRRGDYQAELRDGQVYVPWKEKFIELAGVAEATALQEATSPSRRLNVFRLDG